MKYQRKLTLCALGAIALIGTAVNRASADDLNPPSWRGTANSTFEEWEFSTNANPSTISSVSNSFGSPTAQVNVDANGTGWYNTLSGVYGSQQGWWDIGTGSIVLTVPNDPAPSLTEQIQIQITYWKDINQAPTLLFSPNATQIGSTLTTLVENGPVGGSWFSDLTLWSVPVSPGSQTITIKANQSFGSQIDEVVVDTRAVAAVPEPSAFLLVAIAVVPFAFGSRLRRFIKA